MSHEDVVRRLFTCYARGDRPGAEPLVAPDFRFTSPQDDHLDRETWFDRCFPTAHRFVRQDLLHVVPAGDDDVLVLYEYALRESGAAYRNAELHTVRDGQVAEVQVFFGGRVG